MRTSILALNHFTATRASLPPFILGKGQGFLLRGVRDALAIRVRGLLALRAHLLPADRASGGLVGGRLVLCCNESRTAWALLVGAIDRDRGLEILLFLVECFRQLWVDDLLQVFPFENVAAALREAEAFVRQTRADHTLEALDAVVAAAFHRLQIVSQEEVVAAEAI